MTPEHNQTKVDIWVLAKLGLNSRNPKYEQGSPYTVMLDGEVYTSLAQAQSAQTYEVLKSSIKYEIFHLEFPL